MKGILAAAMLIVAAPTLAVAVDTEVAIQSDTSVSLEHGDQRVLKGNVVIEFGNIRLEADKAIQTLDDGEPVRYLATGTPVVLEPLGGPLQGLARITAERVEYLVRDRILLLTDYVLHLSDGSVQKGRSFKLVFP